MTNILTSWRRSREERKKLDLSKCQGLRDLERRWPWVWAVRNTWDDELVRRLTLVQDDRRIAILIGQLPLSSHKMFARFVSDDRSRVVLIRARDSEPWIIPLHDIREAKEKLCQLVLVDEQDTTIYFASTATKNMITDIYDDVRKPRTYMAQ